MNRHQSSDSQRGCKGYYSFMSEKGTTHSGYEPSLVIAGQVIDRYLGLLKMTLTRYGLEEFTEVEPLLPYGHAFSWKGKIATFINKLLTPSGLQIARMCKHDLRDRDLGRDWPINAETMIGLRRLNQLQSALDDIRADGIEGDFMETGVWRGGASIFMAAYNDCYRMKRKVIAADSFEGLPEPSAEFPADAGASWHQVPYLAVSLEQVRANFAKYGLLSDDVIFLQGFFHDTMPNVPSDCLALLRLDGDMYSSTIDVLNGAYDKVSVGGYVIVDDFSLESAKSAVKTFCKERNFEPKLVPIDQDSVFWRRT